MRLRSFIFALSLTLFLASGAMADTLMDLLAEGPIAQVRYHQNGKFKQVVGIAYIKAAPKSVWDVLADLGHYKDFMPKVEEFKVTKREGATIETYQEVEAPGVNPKYTLSQTFDESKYEIKVKPVSGSVKGEWSYKIKPHGDGSLLYYYSYTRLPGYITTFEDEEETMTVGVNAATAVAVVNAFKKRVESLNKKP